MKNILIVEDDLDIRNILTIYLERDYRIVSFSNGEEALEKYIDFNPNLILLDIGLPGMSGFDVCKKIREIDDEIPIIFISASRDEQNKTLSMELGANDYFTKPFDFTKLVACVSKLLKD